MKQYKVLALVGKAGAGKDTILAMAMKRKPELFHEIISCTTRPPREGEHDGVNYFFLDREDFELELEAGLMLEVAEFNDWFYGTELKALSEDKINLGIFNPEGIISLLFDPRIELKVIYIQANDRIRLERQLRREEAPNVREIVRRFGTDETDFRWMDKIPHFDAFNERLSQAKEVTDLVVNVGQSWDNFD